MSNPIDPLMKELCEKYCVSPEDFVSDERTEELGEEGVIIDYEDEG